MKVLETLDIEGLVSKWKADGFKNIITMVGAGISTCKFFSSTFPLNISSTFCFSYFSFWHSRLPFPWHWLVQ